MATGYAARPVSDQSSYEKKLAATRAYFQPNMRIIELGCGTGSTAIAHAPHVAHVRATDLSPAMLDIARDKAKAAGIENMTFEAGAIETLDAADASYDVVLCLSLMHLLRDRALAMRRVYRMLKPGGLFVSSTVCLRDSYFRFAAPVVLAGRAIGKLPYVAFIRETDLEAEIVAAGFEVVESWRPKRDKASFIVARRV